MTRVRPKLVLDHPLWSSKAPLGSFQPISFVVSPIHTVLCCKICNIKPCSSVVDYTPCPQISPRDARHSLHHVQEKSAVYRSVLSVRIYANTRDRTLPARARFSCGTQHDQALSTRNPVIRPSGKMPPEPHENTGSINKITTHLFTLILYHILCQSVQVRGRVSVMGAGCET